MVWVRRLLSEFEYFWHQLSKEKNSTIISWLYSRSRDHRRPFESSFTFIQLFQKTLSGEKQKVFTPRPQGNGGCFKSFFCWQTITPLNWSLILFVIYIELYWTILIILVVKKAQGKITSSPFLVSSIDLRHFQKVFASELSALHFFSSSKILAL